jgi:hypothetical protein
LVQTGILSCVTALLINIIGYFQWELATATTHQFGTCLATQVFCSLPARHTLCHAKTRTTQASLPQQWCYPE